MAGHGMRREGNEMAAFVVKSPSKNVKVNMVDEEKGRSKGVELLES